MEFAYTDEQEALRASAREVLAERSTPAVVRAAMASKAGTDDALWRTIGELGWSGVAIEESLGGLGLGLIELAILMEECGRAIAPVPFVSTQIAAQLVARFPPGAPRDGLLRRIASGEARAAVALGLKDGRWDAAGVSARAELTDVGWTLRGRASLVPEAHLADELVVLARTARARDPREGISAFLVPAERLRTKPKPQPSLDGTRRLADVGLTGATGDLLGVEGQAWDVVSGGLDRAAVLLAAEAVGVATELLERSVAYAKEREQFGRPIGSFQAISHRLADMLLWIETARSHTTFAAWALEEGVPEAPLAAASAKAAASDAVRIAANDAMQVHGGIGFTWEHDLHLFYRRAKFCELYLGDAGRWRERIAGALAAG